MSQQLYSRRLALNRRQLLRSFGTGAVTMAGLCAAAPVLAQPVFASSPFQLGVASGEAAPDRFVIWTRLAPDPLAPGYGMPAAVVEVEWEIGRDEGLSQIVQRGTALARPELGHAVHVEVGGLEPRRPYWYRFIAGGQRSAIGRSVTAPATGQSMDRLRFAVAGCQHYEHGFYNAHHHLAEEVPDFVYCYGDYIYEGGAAPDSSIGHGPVRQHLGVELYSIEGYRRRYAQYKMDAGLQAAHAAAPWFVSFDDHEIDNNWAGKTDEKATPPAIFALRKQMAMQAFYEHMPLRASSLPIGPAMQLYRQAQYGDLLDLNLLDTRQYRTDQACGDAWLTPCDQINREAEMLGRQQEAWLTDRLRHSSARWKVLAQQVMMMDLDRTPGEQASVNLDSWAGYRLPRGRVLQALKDLRIDNAIVLTGDEHQNYAGELQLDGQHPDTAPVAAEFVTTSLTSGGDGQAVRPATIAIQQENPQLKWHNDQRGYLVCDVTHDRWLADFKVVDKVSSRGSTLQSAGQIVVEAGSSGRLQPA